jgi:hypothetical protein
MKFKTALLACALTFGAATAATTAYAADAAKPAPYKPPHTAWGAPDLQNTWTNVTLTPLERPAAMASRKALTEKEVAEREGRAMENVHYENKPTDPNVGSEDTSRKNCQGAGGRDCGYNAGWKDETTKVMRVRGEPRTSFITSTPDGRIPKRIGVQDATAAARERQAAEGEGAASRPGQSDNPETRGLGERCIAFGNAAGPILPNGYYNNNIQIFQSRDGVAIELEMVHEVRNVRIGGKMSTNGVRPWFGESVGHYEGDTLVVETANYHPQTSFRGSSANMTLTERFTRVAKDRLLYQFTVSDPSVWAQAWSGEYEFYPTNGSMYEYACHEGNYGLEGILAGARAEEAEARAKDGKPVANR